VSKLTKEDMDVVRRILINPDRAEALPYMAETLLGPSNEEGIPPMYGELPDIFFSSLNALL
jgi:hypothetical protein